MKITLTYKTDFNSNSIQNTLEIQQKQRHGIHQRRFDESGVNYLDIF